MSRAGLELSTPRSGVKRLNHSATDSLDVRKVDSIDIHACPKCTNI